MIIIKKGVMPDGTKIQIEDWNPDYHKAYKVGDLLVAYPISKVTTKYGFIRANEIFRCEMQFKNYKEAELAFNNLVKGTKTLDDYLPQMTYTHRYYYTGEKI